MSIMSRRSLSPSPRAAFERQLWAEFFGSLICSAREQRTLSVEEAARAAGMAASEWDAIEAGTVPGTREQLQTVAAGLGIQWEDFAGVVIFCRPAWGWPFPGVSYS